MQTGLQRPPTETLEEQRKGDDRSLVPRPQLVDTRTIGWSVRQVGPAIVGTAFLYPPMVLFLGSGLPEWLKTGACAVALAAGAGLAWGRPWLRRRLADRAFHRVPIRAHLLGAARGELVRLRGRVQLRENTFRSLRGKTVVVVRSLGMYARFRGWGGIRCETQAVDFDLRLDHPDGTSASVRICVPHLQLLPHPPPAPMRLEEARYDEERVSPGDEIEVVGAVDFAADPSGASGSSDRQARLAPMLVGSETQPLRLRRVLPPG